MPPANIPFFIFVLLFVVGFFGLIIYFHRRHGRSKKTSPLVGIAKPPLEHGRPKQFSAINIYDFVKTKVAPQPPDEWPEVPHMTVTWGEPEDNCTVELYLHLSYEERAAIKRYGLNEKPLDEEQLFSDEDLEKIEEAQQRELRRATDPRTRAALESEHRHQLEEARRDKWGLTIEYYLTCPFTKTLPTPYQATLYRKRLEQKVLPEIRNMLKEYVE